MEPIIKVENAKVVYNEGKDNEFVALRDINLEVFPQEYLIFYGPSGCGKSTLLYTILGLQNVSEGKVYINGRDSAKFSEADKNDTSSHFYGIIFQNFNLIYSLNVIDNVMLPQVFIDVSKKEREEKAMQLLQRFGLDQRTKNLTTNLSGGQQQRVAICRSLINDPKVLLADEPVGNLDSESAEIVMETLKDIHQKDKKTVVLVTHDARYLPYADRVCYFKDGHIEKIVVNKNHVIKPLEDIGEDEDAVGGRKRLVAVDKLDQLERMARVHKFMTTEQLKAWSLTNYIAEELTLNQTERLEQVMEQLLSGKLSEHDFFEQLNLSYKKGGVGLYRTTAIKYSLLVSEVLKKVEVLVQDTKKKKDDLGDHKKIVHMLREYLIKDYSGKIEPEQLKSIEEAIEYRLGSHCTAEEFVQFLDMPVSEGGVGLSILTAQNLSERLEIIIAQTTAEISK